jgi:hypothetical protein
VEPGAGGERLGRDDAGVARRAEQGRGPLPRTDASCAIEGSLLRFTPFRSAEWEGLLRAERPEPFLLRLLHAKSLSLWRDAAL